MLIDILRLKSINRKFYKLRCYFEERGIPIDEEATEKGNLSRMPRNRKNIQEHLNI
jgi:hypothetical protein